MGLSCASQHENVSGLVTLSLNMDFVSAAQKGEWLEFETYFVKTGRSIDTAQGRVTADGRVCTLCSASFKVTSG